MIDEVSKTNRQSKTSLIPGTPPIGTYSDFVAFFWVEVLIALSLLTILTVWLFRPPAK